ncbi:hypothetical protein DOJ94_23670 [Salmonella bongori]|nr:hypothetical protein [Salmonella bongori]
MLSVSFRLLPILPCQLQQPVTEDNRPRNEYKFCAHLQGPDCSVLYFSEVILVTLITKMKIHAVDTESEAA